MVECAVIVLSIESDEEEKVRLLKLGADDYVVKPFGIAELLARGDAALRRYFKSKTEDPVVVARPLSIDLVGRVVSVNRIESNSRERSTGSFTSWRPTSD